MEQFEPFRRIWAAVMIQAYRDLKDHNRVVREQAFQWIHEIAPTGEGGFKWICTCLDLDREALQAASLSREGINKVIYGNSKRKDIL